MLRLCGVWFRVLSSKQLKDSDAQSRIHYKVVNSYFANNRRIAGTGTGARIEFADIDSSFLEMSGTTITPTPIAFEMDQSKRNFLHPVSDSQAAKIGAGLFSVSQG